MDDTPQESISQILDAVGRLAPFAPEDESEAVWRGYAEAAYDLARTDADAAEVGLIDRASSGDATEAAKHLRVLELLGTYVGSFRAATFGRLAAWCGDGAAEAVVREASLRALILGEFPLIEPSGMAILLGVLVDPGRRPANLPTDLMEAIAIQAGRMGDRLAAHGEFVAGMVMLAPGLLDRLFDANSPDSLARADRDPGRREAIVRMIVESSRVPPPLRFPMVRRRGTRSHRIREVQLLIPTPTALRSVSLVVVWAEGRGRYARHAADAFLGGPGDRPDVLARVRRRYGWLARLAHYRRTYRNPSASAPAS